MRILSLLALGLACLAGCRPAPQPDGQPARKAVFIIIDGIPADVVERVSTPALDDIAAAGGYTRAYVGGEKGGYSQTPTISAPGYMSLLTATWANKHNVWDNYSQSPNYAYWNVFRIVETADSSLKTAIFSTWLDNRTVLVGEGQPQAGDFRIDHAFDGFETDTLAFPHDTASQYILAIDEHVATGAARYLADQGPDLSWVYLQYTDDAGHARGDSEAFDSAVQRADAQVGRIWVAVQQRQRDLGEDWMIVVTTDHGRDSLTGMDHGDQSTRERLTWIATNHPQLNARFQAQPGIVDIVPSLLRHLGVEAPEAIAREIDGVPFTGELAVSDLRATLDSNRLHVAWRAHVPTGEAALWLATDNRFRAGQPDTYEPLATLPLADTLATFTLTDAQLAACRRNGILKVVLQTPQQTLNRWVRLDRTTAALP
ncbi:MAG: hypothetical protein OHK0039_44130 [Bacteroidia bacterium]